MTKIRSGRKRTVKATVSESVSSVRTDGAPSDTHSHIRGNLPFALGRFIGRERELPVVRERLASARLLTLTGTGGCGKTRLALEIASGLVSEFTDGIWYVELAPLTERGLVPYIVASTLGLREQSERPIIETLRDALRPRALLIILDNCEHLLTDCAQLCEALLQYCPGVRILATSREPLGAMGEVIWNVLPLALPDSDQALPDDLHQVESVQLFVEKASALMPEFTLSRANAPFVAQICRRLDGLPLAIELAAARCRTLSVQELAFRLGERFELLTQGRRTAPPRQQTLQATIDWSYSLLDADERTAFQCFAVFAGGWTLEAAEAVCKEPRTLDVVSRLVDKSLVIKQERRGNVRYALLDTLRQYARDKLSEAGELDMSHERHLNFFLALAEQAAPWLTRAEELAWLERLRNEDDNLRAALSWSVERDGVKALRLVAALSEFWLLQGNITEGSEWVEKVLTTLSEAPLWARAKGLVIAGELAGHRGERERAASLLQESHSLYAQSGDERGVAWSLQELGYVLNNQGDRVRAVEFLGKSLAIWRRVGDRYNVGECLLQLGDAEFRAGNLEASREHYTEALAILRELGERRYIAFALGGLGDLARLEGNYQEADRSLKEGLQVNFELGVTSDMYYQFEALAILAAMTHAPSRAARLWGAGEALRIAIGTPLSPGYQSDYAPHLQSVQRQLGAAAFEAAWAEGRGMTVEQAVEYALRDTEPQTELALSPNEEPSKLLTQRELEVLRLVVAGLSNREIAAQLVITLGTVKWYTNEIYSKLGVRSRTQAVALANRLDLL